MLLVIDSPVWNISSTGGISCILPKHTLSCGLLMVVVESAPLISHRCSVGLRSGVCEDHMKSFSSSSNQSVTLTPVEFVCEVVTCLYWNVVKFHSMHILVGSVNETVKCCVSPVWSSEWSFSGARQSSSGLDGRERKKSRELGGWRRRLQQPRAGSHLPVDTHLISYETAITHVHDVIRIWCVSSLSLRRLNLILEVLLV